MEQPSAYSDSSALTFDDSAVPGTTNIVIDPNTTVQPYSLVFNNNSLAYSFSGGAIGGAATVSVSGAAGVTFYNSNSYTGATTISLGVLTLANSNAIQGSTATISVNNGLAFAGGIGTFNLGGLAGSGNLLLTDANSADVALSIGANGQSTQFSGNISDTAAGGKLIVVGGQLNLSGVNTYGGGTTVSAGTLQLGSATALGAGGLTANGGIVDLAGISPAALPSLNGVAGTITTSVASPVTLTVNPTALSVFGGVLQNGSGTLSLTVGGPGLLSLSGTNTYGGTTTIARAAGRQRPAQRQAPSPSRAVRSRAAAWLATT